jgi:predicted  nucleic acid-binding Zn-ribbon protein
MDDLANKNDALRALEAKLMAIKKDVDLALQEIRAQRTPAKKQSGPVVIRRNGKKYTI